MSEKIDKLKGNIEKVTRMIEPESWIPERLKGTVLKLLNDSSKMTDEIKKDLEWYSKERDDLIRSLPSAD